MIENNKFAIGLSGKQLKVYNDLKEMIVAVDKEVKEDANRNHHRYYASFRFSPGHKRVGLQLHRHNSNIALVIPGSYRRFPKFDIENVDVQYLSGYCVTQNRFWLNATKKNCWPPKPAKGFIILLEQLQNSDLREQINKILQFAKENSDRWEQDKR
jgi:hypothetical protein